VTSPKDSHHFVIASSFWVSFTPIPLTTSFFLRFSALGELREDKEDKERRDVEPFPTLGYTILGNCGKLSTGV
jgi:hypothetical protein